MYIWVAHLESSFSFPLGHRGIKKTPTARPKQSILSKAHAVPPKLDSTPRKASLRPIVVVTREDGFLPHPCERVTFLAAAWKGRRQMVSPSWLWAGLVWDG